MHIIHKVLAQMLAGVSAGWALCDSALAADCQPVAGHETGGQITEGCASPIGFCSGGNIDATRGLKGSVLFIADSIAPGPATQPGYV